MAVATMESLISATEIAQQSPPAGASIQPKSGASKFDQLLDDPAQSAAESTQAEPQADPGAFESGAWEPVRADGALTEQAVEQVGASERPRATTNLMTKMVDDLERGQGVLESILNEGLTGKEFSSSELIALQAGIYRYSQELELTGKVVEKATTGLKDTLRTQV
ncbi:MAG TPA: ATP-dependent helicase HrpB [Myxococcaceae bacterium]|nr:ATP-dependent helicase HrpB [Myxococcaceae bacterium]